MLLAELLREDPQAVERGLLEAQEEQERGGYYARERRQGTFRRSMTLPESVDEESIRARFEDGVLEVTIERAPRLGSPSASRSRALLLKRRASRAKLLAAELAARQRPSSETAWGSRGRDCFGSFSASLAARSVRAAVMGRCSSTLFSECGEEKRLEVGPE